MREGGEYREATRKVLREGGDREGNKEEGKENGGGKREGESRRNRNTRV